MVAISLSNAELNIASRRRMLPGPESTLLLNALESGIPIFQSTPDKLFLEFEMPTGFPDVLAVYSKNKKHIDLDKWSSLTKNHLRILHHIYLKKKVTVDSLLINLLFPKSELGKIILELERRSLLKVTSKSISIQNPSEVFPLKKIIAIEVKMKNWRSCIRQAELNTWFASESYVLMPELTNTNQIFELASRHGIGILFYNGKVVRIARKANKNPIPASFGSWLLAGA
jgi:hypothetical protein